jgi:hypothetical protein
MKIDMMDCKSRHIYYLASKRRFGDGHTTTIVVTEYTLGDQFWVEFNSLTASPASDYEDLAIEVGVAAFLENQPAQLKLRKY